MIIFALPSIFLLPWLAGLLGLTDAQTGAWIGGNIDTTAAVTAAGSIAGEAPLQIAAIVKSTQNALLGVAAVLLTVFFAYKIDRNRKDANGVGQGVVAWDVQVTNQNDELVASYDILTLVAKRG